MFRLFVLISIVSLGSACSDSSNQGQSYELSANECKALGGELVSGQCQQEMSPTKMKALCKQMGLKYLPEHNGCLQG